MQIGRKDILWNYAATFLRIASSALLLPFILRMMPSEMVGIWTVFMTITAFSGLLDFGFNPSFTRNVTYIFSGVRSLKVEGFESVSTDNQTVDFGLLKGVIVAMRWFYLRIAIVLFLLLATLGTYYIYSLLQTYNGDHKEVFIAWLLLGVINSYNLFTLYYDSLVQGKGLVKRSKQIVIIGQSVYLIIATILIISGYGLVAIVCAQAASVIIIRWLSYNAFFTIELKKKLHEATAIPKTDILKAITPNALKIGLTALGSFMVSRSAIVVASLYLPLEKIASYGITMQLIGIISGLASIFIATYNPKIAQLRIEQDIPAIKELYLKGLIVLFLTFVSGGIGLLVMGEWALNFIGSKTSLMPQMLILFAIIVSFLECNHAIAGSILLSKNEVPFFKASLISGGATVFLLILFFHYTNLDLWAMVAAPGISQVVYQNWKWPTMVFHELDVTKADIFKSIVNILSFNKQHSL